MNDPEQTLLLYYYNKKPRDVRKRKVPNKSFSAREDIAPIETHEVESNSYALEKRVDSGVKRKFHYVEPVAVFLREEIEIALNDFVKRLFYFVSRKYDSRTTEFSPDGRLHQIEYSMEAISKGSTGIGICTKNGIVFAAERSCLIAGLQSDANTVIEFAQRQAQDYRFDYNEPIPLEMLTRRVCNLKHSYTQQGGYRPFGVGLLYGGWDSREGFCLFESDPSGNFAGWHAVAIGSNANAAREVLKKEFSDGMELREAEVLAVKALAKANDEGEPEVEKMEFSTVTKVDGESEGVVWKVLKEAEVKELVDRAKAELAKEDGDKE